MADEPRKRVKTSPGRRGGGKKGKTLGAETTNNNTGKTHPW